MRRTEADAEGWVTVKVYERVTSHAMPAGNVAELFDDMGGGRDGVRKTRNSTR